MNRSKHSPETLERMKANADAAKRRLSQLNNEYQVRQKAQKLSHAKVSPNTETFGQAVSRIAREAQIVI
jgi:hypothetical protein